jgi:hypothetical protein
VVWLHFVPQQALTHCELDLTLWPIKLTVDRFLLKRSLYLERVNHDSCSGGSLKESLFSSMTKIGLSSRMCFFYHVVIVKFIAVVVMLFGLSTMIRHITVSSTVKESTHR